MWFNKEGIRKDIQDGRRIRWEITFTPQIHKKSPSACGITLTEWILNSSRRPQTLERQTNGLRMRHSKIKRLKKKKKGKGFWNRDLHPRQEVLKEETFPHIWKTPSPVVTVRSFRISKGNTATGVCTTKWREFTKDIMPKSTSQIRSALHDQDWLP